MRALVFCAGGIVGGVFVLSATIGAAETWHHALIDNSATLSRLYARWIISDALGTFEGNPTEKLIPFLHRYATDRTTFRTTSRTTSRSTTPDATEER